MDWVISPLLWLDADPVRYWTLAWTVFGLTVAAAFASPAVPAQPGRTLGRLLFGAGLFLTLAAFRWPTWFVPDNLNPDEAQMIAGAITLRRFPIYWKFVDGATNGPLCALPLLVASFLGAPLNYVTARVVAAALQAASLIGVWGTLRCFTSERIARLAVLPGLAFWALVSFHDYVNYSSELAGLCLLALAGWGLARVLTSAASGTRESWLIYSSGLALGAVPLAKLQAAPQGAAMALIGLVLLWRGSDAPPGARWRLAGSFVAGGLSVSVLVLAFLLVYGLWGQFWTSYILSNLAYAHTGAPLDEMPSRFLNLSLVAYSFAWFLAGTLAFALLYARESSRAPRALRTAGTVGWIVLGVAYLSVVLPGRDSTHYLHLLVIPATLLAGLVLASATSGPPGTSARWYAGWIPVGAFCLLTLAPQIYHRAVAYHEFLGHLSTNLEQRQSSAARYIAQHSRSSDTLAMWGWEPNLFVQTGLPQGTRDGCSAFQLTSGPLQSFYVLRYLADMRRRRPDWFVDAVGPGGFMYTDRGVFAHENSTELRELINKDYQFMTEFENKRIYRLKRSDAPQ